MSDARSLHIEYMDSPLGELTVGSDADGCLHLLVWKRVERPASSGPSSKPAQVLKAYFDGDLEAIDSLSVARPGTAFQREVWAELRNIPCGTTISYAELAERIGRPKAVRAVGTANGANPVPIVVPCHRVIGANGTLTGYGGGLEKKRWLLVHEGALLL